VQWQNDERVGREVEDHFVAPQAQEPDIKGLDDEVVELVDWSLILVVICENGDANLLHHVVVGFDPWK
jgi:hypothetical protein